MAKQRDEGGEIKGNRAGFAASDDLPTTPTFDDAVITANDEKTRPIFPQSMTADLGEHRLCVGWLVVWNGPGRGISHVIQPGSNSIGRAKADIVLNHGDKGISSEGKLSVEYEPRTNTFAFVNRGSKNVPLCNGAPVHTSHSLNDGDVMTIGDTELMFVPFCNASRRWQ